jgi:pheromone shutdown protein TraB
MIGERNRVALAEALQESARHDVALVWGAGHLPGLARELRRRGYRLRAERWLQVCVL